MFPTRTTFPRQQGRDADFESHAPKGHAKYSIVRESVAFSQLLPSDFILRAVASAQQTHDLLIPGEQFGMGGADNVRGYYERETASDKGQRSRSEGYGPDFGSWISGNWRARALVFRRRCERPRQCSHTGPDNKLGSFGLGVRANQGKSSRSGSMWHGSTKERWHSA